MKEKFKSYVEFNLFNDNLAKETFETSMTAKEMLLRFSSLTSVTLIPYETVIFIDEIQCAKEVITKIKFLVEEGSYKYIFSGSLLGVEINDVNSIPVGYMEIAEMYPLDFEEFAKANKVSDNVMSYLKDCYMNKTSIDPVIHEQMIKLFNLYVIVGGFPEAVVKYLETNNLQQVYAVLENIDKARFYQYEDSFVWLRDSNVGLFVYNVDNPIYPLLASKGRNLFKLFLCDVGLLTYKYANNSAIKILNNDININYGSIYENVVAQELKSKNFALFYYNNKKKGEVDFLIENGEKIIPIEVKSGKNYKRHLALDNLLTSPEYDITESITFSNGNLEVKGKKVYLPIYMIMFIGKDNEDLDMTIKIDISKLTK